MDIGPEEVWHTGEKVRPWVFDTTLSWEEKNFEYKYSLYDSTKDSSMWEREPSRRLVLTHPSEYSISNQLEDQRQTINDVFVINGSIYKSDVNFVSKLNYDEVDDLDIIIGCYPQSMDDIEEL